MCHMCLNVVGLDWIGLDPLTEIYFFLLQYVQILLPPPPIYSRFMNGKNMKGKMAPTRERERERGIMHQIMLLCGWGKLSDAAAAASKGVPKALVSSSSIGNTGETAPPLKEESLSNWRNWTPKDDDVVVKSQTWGNMGMYLDFQKLSPEVEILEAIVLDELKPRVAIKFHLED